MQNRVVVADSVTKLGDDARGGVVVAASHGGVFAAHTGALAGARALILNDAGVGLDDAGIAGLVYLQTYGVPCAAVDYRSARIGDGQDTLERGVISRLNVCAADLGVRAGMTAREATRLLHSALPAIAAPTAELAESRKRADARAGSTAVWLLDSASLVMPQDAGTIVVTGSHGGLLGGKPAAAVRADVAAALFNDAGVGIDDAGITRLPALDTRGIAGATVSAMSARIGDAQSTYQDGTISHVNATAARLGAHNGMAARDFVRLVVEVLEKTHGAHQDKQGDFL